jgi:hypothetical protein
MSDLLAQVPPPVWLPVVASAILLGLSIHRHPGDRWNPGRVVTFAYLLMSTSSLVFDARLAPTFEFTVQWSVIVPYTLLLCLTLAPALLINRPDPTTIANNRLVRPMLMFSVPLVAFSAIYLTGSALGSIGRGFSATRDALNVTGEAVLPGGLATTIAVATASYYPLFAILLFASLARRSGWLATGAAAAGVGLAVVHAASFGARDGVLWAAQALAVAYWALGSLMGRAARRWLLLAGVCSTVAGLVYLHAATEDRFGGAQGSYWSGVFGYFGSQPYVFAETVTRLVEFYGPNLRFPVFAQLTGLEEIRRTQPYQWSFGTFLADFYSVSGWPTAVGLSMGLVALTVLGLRVSRPRSGLAYAIVVAAYTQFMVQGVFYFRLGNNAGNLFHLSLVALVLLLVVFFPDERPRGRAWRTRQAVDTSDPPSPGRGPIGGQ